MTRRDTLDTPSDTNYTLDVPSYRWSMFQFVEHTPSERTAGAVRAELARRKLTGRKLAEALGWSSTTTWRRLNGSHPFDIDELAAVAAYLGVPVSTFVSDRDVAA